MLSQKITRLFLLNTTYRDWPSTKKGEEKNRENFQSLWPGLMSPINSLDCAGLLLNEIIVVCASVIIRLLFLSISSGGQPVLRCTRSVRLPFEWWWCCCWWYSSLFSRIKQYRSDVGLFWCLCIRTVPLCRFNFLDTF